MEKVDQSLWECSQVAGEASLTESARTYYVDWYNTHFYEFLHNPDDEHDNSLFRKHAAIALKLAILFEVSETRQLKVSENNIVLATRFMDHLNFIMRRFLEEEMTNSRERELCEKVLNLLREAGPNGMLESALQRRGKTTSQFLKMALESLTNENAVAPLPATAGLKGGRPGKRWYAIIK